MTFSLAVETTKNAFAPTGVTYESYDALYDAAKALGKTTIRTNVTENGKTRVDFEGMGRDCPADFEEE